MENLLQVSVHSDARLNQGGGQAATGPPIFGRAVNPIPTGEGRLLLSVHPNSFHL